METILTRPLVQTYDTLHPVDEINEFNAFLRKVVARYDDNVVMQAEYDRMQNDLLHYAELHDDMSASAGTKLYKNIRDVRRARRNLKSENELLYPIYMYLKENTRFTNDLNQLLGRCRTVKSTVENRSYIARSDII